MYITYDVMYDVTVWYHNYVISYPKNCDITCDIIGNKKIHHMWYHIHFSTSHHDITYDITGMISHNCIWYHMWHHMWYHIWYHIWYHMWYHMILVSSRAAAVATRLGCRRRSFLLVVGSLQDDPIVIVRRHAAATTTLWVFKSWMCFLRLASTESPTSPGARLVTMPDRHHPAPARWARHHCCDSWSGTVRLHEITNHSANWC